MQQVDYLLIGQGISGTMLSYELHKQNKSFIIIDEANEYTASKVASGVINPVTGRQIITTWLADKLFAKAWEAYQEMGYLLGDTFIEELPMYSFPLTAQMQEAYAESMLKQDTYIFMNEHFGNYHQYFNTYFGSALIKPVYMVQLQNLLAKWRLYLVNKQKIINEKFEVSALQMLPDGIVYKQINATKIIFCDGISSYTLPYFKNLPYVYNKGEALIVNIPQLPVNNLYKFGTLTIVPWQKGLWWVGSSYENNPADALPSAPFRMQKEKQLNELLKIPYQVVNHLAAIRPATMERRPFVGLHPLHNNIGIFNGMGTKGTSLAPYFAAEFVASLVNNAPLHPEVNINRYRKILSMA